MSGTRECGLDGSSRGDGDQDGRGVFETVGGVACSV